MLYQDPNDPCALQNLAPCWEWFAAENPGKQNPVGCVAPLSEFALQIPPTGSEQNGYDNGFPCYHHNSLPTLLDSASITWKYYAPNNSIWTAPNSVEDICLPSPSPRGNSEICTGPDWINDVEPYIGNEQQILTDLGANPDDQKCSLAQVTWVIPDGNWSDHAGGQATAAAGPSWVAAIVNALGGYDNSGHRLTPHCPYWDNTVVLVVWDDWGGFYDDVPPPDCSGSTCTGYPNGSGGQYVYGFRVPLLVVSAWTPAGYISGPCNPQTGSCAGAEQQRYVHDFGSIPNFIEYVFGTGGQLVGSQTYPTGIGAQQYPYADWFAPDSPHGGCDITLCPYSLSDFNFNQTVRSFVPITGATYATTCIFNPSNPGCLPNYYPADPDDDENDQ